MVASAQEATFANQSRRDSRGDVMEQTLSSISPAELYGRLGTASAPTVVDVRRLADFATADQLIISAYHRDPDEVEQWGKELPRGRQVVVHCVHGRELSQSLAAELRA